MRPECLVGLQKFRIPIFFARWRGNAATKLTCQRGERDGCVRCAVTRDFFDGETMAKPRVVTLGDELAVKRADALLAQHIRERAICWVFKFGRGLDSERQRVEGRRS